MIYSCGDTIISETKTSCIIVDNSYSTATLVPPPPGDSLRNTQNSLSSKVPPACGGPGGQVVHLKMIKELQPGDRIIDLGNNTVSIKQTKSDHYTGKIIEVSLKESNQSLYMLPENLVLCQRNTTKSSPTGHWGDIPEHYFQRARQLRQQTTPPEKRLWQYLRSKQLGIKFRSQYPINHYIVDFYARKAGLVVEVDGESAHTYPDHI